MTEFKLKDKMNCEICGKESKPIIHYLGVDRCSKCDKLNDMKILLDRKEQGED